MSSSPSPPTVTQLMSLGAPNDPNLNTDSNILHSDPSTTTTTDSNVAADTSSSPVNTVDTTVDDELIARLLQDEFDQELRLAALESKNSSINIPHATMTLDDHDPTLNKRIPTPSSSTFGISDASEVVKAKLTDLISYIKTEATRAGQSLKTPITPTNLSPSENYAAERSASLSPTSPTATNSIPTSFDFSKFLDLMRDRRALPLTKYFRSFLREFTKRNWTVNEQIKIISDFLEFMSVQISKNELFVGASDEDLDLAKEGMEKLLMNKLHQYTFSPPTSDDSVKDEVLFKKISILQWIELKHLDIHLNIDRANPFLRVAQKELLKINDYRAPRDKLICILNACKLIFGLLKQSQQSENADTFLPLLIYVVLQSNPPHLHSNVQYISRFRSPTKLASESGYYLTNLQGAMSFIESIDHTALSIAKTEFDNRIEQHMRYLETREVDRRTQPKSLGTLDNNPNSLNVANNSSSSSSSLSSSSSPTITSSTMTTSLVPPPLEQIASNVKKPIEMVSRWLTQAAASLNISDMDSTSPKSTTTTTSSSNLHQSYNNKVNNTNNHNMTTEMNVIDISKLSAEERLLITDYELQLAMAMSMSLEEERKQWEQVPDTILSDNIDSTSDSNNCNNTNVTNLIELEDDNNNNNNVNSDQFSIEASAKAASHHSSSPTSITTTDIPPTTPTTPITIITTEKNDNEINK